MSAALAVALTGVANRRVPNKLARVGRNHQRWYPVGHKSVLEQIQTTTDLAHLDWLEQQMNRPDVTPNTGTRKRWHAALSKRRGELSQ